MKIRNSILMIACLLLMPLVMMAQVERLGEDAVRL